MLCMLPSCPHLYSSLHSATRPGTPLSVRVILYRHWALLWVHCKKISCWWPAAGHAWLGSLLPYKTISRAAEPLNPMPSHVQAWPDQCSSLGEALLPLHVACTAGYILKRPGAYADGQCDRDSPLLNQCFSLLPDLNQRCCQAWQEEGSDASDCACRLCGRSLRSKKWSTILGSTSCPS